jgi:hypothetical protein
MNLNSQSLGKILAEHLLGESEADAPEPSRALGGSK